MTTESDEKKADIPAQHLYKCPGPYVQHGIMYGIKGVKHSLDKAAALKDGWFETFEEAGKAAGSKALAPVKKQPKNWKKNRGNPVKKAPVDPPKPKVSEGPTDEYKERVKELEADFEAKREALIEKARKDMEEEIDEKVKAALELKEKEVIAKAEKDIADAKAEKAKKAKLEADKKAKAKAKAEKAKLKADK